VLDFGAFVDETSKRLAIDIAHYGYNIVWFTERENHVEWRREAWGIRLRRHTLSSAIFTRYHKVARRGPAEIAIMDEAGASRLVGAILDHSNGCGLYIADADILKMRN
jgi:hypothetical protein